MASHSSPTQPKRRGICGVVRGGLHQLKQALKPSYRLPSLHQEGSVPLNVISPSPPPSVTLNSTHEPADQSMAPVSLLQSPSGHVTRTLRAGANSSLGTADAAPTTATESTTNERLKGVWKTAWTGFETALRVLERSADACPPLKSAVGGFLACLDIVQVSHVRRSSNSCG
jgi:hypothetical protein